MKYAFAAASAIVFVFVFFIWKKARKTTADYLLIGINLLICLFLLAEVLIQEGLTSARLIFQNAVPLFLFPVFTTYCFEFVRENSWLRRTRFLLFGPGILFVLYSCFDHYLLTDYDSQGLMEHYTAPSLTYHFFFKGSQLLFISVLIYLLRKIISFDEELKKSYSYIETVSLDWLRNFTWIYLLSIALSFVLFLSHNLGLLNINIGAVFGVVYGVLVLSVFYMNVEGIRHYTLVQEYGNQEDLSAPPQETESESNETDERLKGIHQQIIDLFEGEKPYIQGKYGLQQLSSDLGVSSHLVSDALNKIEGKNFYDFVNAYRVETFKSLLQDPSNKQFTILHLGLDSGFNSKASLNRIFKNQTGLTPKQYLDSIQ